MTTPSSPRNNTPYNTLFLSPQDVAGIVSRSGLAATLQGMATYIRQDFLRWQSFDKSARLAAHSADGVIELMPIADANTYTFKYVNGHPKNTAVGLPTVMAFGVLADVASGFPLLISELTLTTAMRTAATSAVAARALARPDSRVMALIGNGAQSEFQALAFHHLVGIEEIRLFDVDTRATAKLLRNLQNNPDAAGLRLVVCNSTAEAVRGADIVTTVTADKTNATIITPEMLTPGGTVDIPLALPRRMSVWTYDVRDAEVLYTPFGAIDAVPLQPRRESRKKDELSAQVWFAPSLRYLPVRIRIQQDTNTDTYVDLMIERRPQIAGP